MDRAVRHRLGRRAAGVRVPRLAAAGLVPYAVRHVVRTRVRGHDVLRRGVHGRTNRARHGVQGRPRNAVRAEAHTVAILDRASRGGGGAVVVVLGRDRVMGAYLVAGTILAVVAWLVRAPVRRAIERALVWMVPPR